jgi:hypothetical protein
MENFPSEHFYGHSYSLSRLFVGSTNGFFMWTVSTNILCGLRASHKRVRMSPRQQMSCLCLNVPVCHDYTLPSALLASWSTQRKRKHCPIARKDVAHNAQKNIHTYISTCIQTRSPPFRPCPWVVTYSWGNSVSICICRTVVTVRGPRYICNPCISSWNRIEIRIKIVCEIWLRKSEGSRPLEIPRRQWENNIKTDVQEIGW